MKESIWLTDPIKRLIKRNVALTFVNTSTKRNIKSIAVPCPKVDLMFTDINSGKILQQVLDVYDYYIERRDMENLCLAQFAMFYIGGNIDNDDDEPAEPTNSNVPIAVYHNDNVMFMKSIVKVRRGKILKLQKNPSVLKYPVYPYLGDEFIHQQVILYHPHSSFDELNDELTVNRLYNETFFDTNGRCKKKIEIVKSKLHPSMKNSNWRYIFSEVISG